MTDLRPAARLAQRGRIVRGRQYAGSRTRRQRRRCLGALLLSALSFSLAASAVEAEEKLGNLSVQIENDLFGSQDDGHYTHGTRFSYLSPPVHENDWLQGGWRQAVLEAADALPLFYRGSRFRVAYALGQNMYTPADIRQTRVQTEDRPYAGFLYGSLGLVAESEHRRLDTLDLTLGVVGPLSLAEQTQRAVHEIVNSPDPKGWGNQLRNEPAVILAYERKWRRALRFANGATEFDVTPHAGLSLGNVFTYANAGGALRWGDDLSIDYGPPRIRPSLPGSGFFEAENDRLHWYLFAGVEGRAVARNIFLDGNSFADSHSVDREWLVGDLQAGLVLTWRHARLSFTHVIRSREFRGQTRPDRFGAISLTLRY